MGESAQLTCFYIFFTRLNICVFEQCSNVMLSLCSKYQGSSWREGPSLGFQGTHPQQIQNLVEKRCAQVCSIVHVQFVLCCYFSSRLDWFLVLFRTLLPRCCDQIRKAHQHDPKRTMKLSWWVISASEYSSMQVISPLRKALRWNISEGPPKLG